MIVERCTIARWNRLITTSRMVVRSTSMITGCRDIERNVKNQHFVFCDTAPFDVSLNNSASNDRRKMHHSSLESSHNDESNGG
ncbi:unnamed protein product [Rhizophagus irregularis]|nr:unnamed protein product [Rhizophagus irregularis]